MFVPVLLLSMCVTFVAALENPFYRRDYCYINQFDAFYKLHSSQNGTNWTSAFIACEDEESSLFYPKEEGEWTVVKSLLTLKPKPNVTDILVGIRDESGVGTFTTVDGSPFSSEIGFEQATIHGPSCTFMNVGSGSYKTVQCDDTAHLPFVCKKRMTKYCPTVDTAYTYTKETNKCYKFHETKKTWPIAMQTCFLEGGSLVMMKNSDEAAILGDRIITIEKAYFVGFWRLTPNGKLYTVGGQRFDDSTFNSKWYHKYNHCGTFHRHRSNVTDNIVMSIHTSDCLEPKPFVCEMVPKTSWRNWVNQGMEPPASLTNPMTIFDNDD